jgi:Rrf2 family protein
MIKISSKGHYSLRILMLMASQPQGRMFTKHQIATAETVPSAYVQQLMTRLRTAGFVNSHRGKVGGFTLARPSDGITVADVLKATEGRVSPAPCMGTKKCDRQHYCPARDMWMNAAKLAEDYFSGVTLAALVERAGNDIPGIAETA